MVWMNSQVAPLVIGDVQAAVIAVQKVVPVFGLTLMAW